MGQLKLTVTQQSPADQSSTALLPLGAHDSPGGPGLNKQLSLPAFHQGQGIPLPHTGQLLILPPPCDKFDTSLPRDSDCPSQQPPKGPKSKLALACASPHKYISGEGADLGALGCQSEKKQDSSPNTRLRATSSLLHQDLLPVSLDTRSTHHFLTQTQYPGLAGQQDGLLREGTVDTSCSQ